MKSTPVSWMGMDNESLDRSEGSFFLVGCISAEELCRPVPGHHDNAYPLGPHASMPEIASLFCDALTCFHQFTTRQQEACTRTLGSRHSRSATDCPAHWRQQPPFPAIPVYGNPCLCLSIARACWPSNSLVQMSLIESSKT